MARLLDKLGKSRRLDGSRISAERPVYFTPSARWTIHKNRLFVETWIVGHNYGVDERAIAAVR